MRALIRLFPFAYPSGLTSMSQFSNCSIDKLASRSFTLRACVYAAASQLAPFVGRS